MTDLKYYTILCILSISICSLFYVLVNILDDSDWYLDMINNMNAICKSNWYTTYIYPSSWWLDSSNFRCQKIEYTYSKEYFKL